MARRVATKYTGRIPFAMLRKLKEARKSATFEDARFGFCDPKLDAMVKEETRVYRQSWIIPQLDEVIAWAEGKPAK